MTSFWSLFSFIPLYLLHQRSQDIKFRARVDWNIFYEQIRFFNQKRWFINLSNLPAHLLLASLQVYEILYILYMKFYIYINIYIYIYIYNIYKIIYIKNIYNICIYIYIYILQYFINIYYIYLI